jgi:hypothetical protein
MSKKIPRLADLEKRRKLHQKAPHVYQPALNLRNLDTLKSLKLKSFRKLSLTKAQGK